MARSALSSADCMIASCITARASLGSGRLAFSSISRVSRSWSRLPQFTPMRTGLAVPQRDVDDLGKLPVALVLEADIAGIDAIFGERLGAGRMLRRAACGRYSGSRRQAARRRRAASSLSRICGTAAAASARSTVMRTSSESGAGKRRDLGHGGLDIGGVGVGHRLHHDGRAATDSDIADLDRNRAPARPRYHGRRIHHICELCPRQAQT